MFFIPIVYFEYGMDFADYVDLTLHEVVSVFVIIAAIGEGIRLKLDLPFLDNEIMNLDRYLL